MLPIRQTASIFKQPVTVVRTRPESVTKSDLKHGPQEKPRQVSLLIHFQADILKPTSTLYVYKQRFLNLQVPYMFINRDF